MSSITINTPEVRTLYPPKNVSTKFHYEAIIRTGLWSIGTIIFCMGLVDFYAQTYARETEIGLQNIQAMKLKANRDLRISDINQFIAGSPTVQTLPADAHTHMCKVMKKYTWKGFFKTYSISVYIGLGNDLSINFIHGLNDLVLRERQLGASI